MNFHFVSQVSNDIYNTKKVNSVVLPIRSN